MLDSNRSVTDADITETVQEINENEEESPQFPYYLSRRSSGRSLRHQFRREPNKIRRLLRKNGKATVYRLKIPQHWFRYLSDLGNTLINTRWRWTVVTLGFIFFATWIIFACVWMLIAVANGDGDEEVTTPCLTGVQGFWGYLLYSVETQATLGYGHREITHNCPEAVFILCVQMILGAGLCGALVSIVYAKMTIPHKYSPRASFSRYAVICLRDGVLCLIFRICDDRKRYEFTTKVNAYLVQNRLEEPFLKTIKLEPLGILIWPLEVVHKITESSPFWDLSARDLILKRFELVVTMEGMSSSTGHLSKTSTSYMSTEIRWGSRFKSCVKPHKTGYLVEQQFFNELEEQTTPLCSAKRLQEVLKESYSSAARSLLSSPAISELRKWDGEESSGIGSFKNELSSPTSSRNEQMTAIAEVHYDNGEASGIPGHQEEAGFVYTQDSISLGSQFESGSVEDFLDYVDEGDECHSPYARRKPFSFIRPKSSENTSRPGSIKRNSEMLLASLQHIFSRQSSRSVTETDL